MNTHHETELERAVRVAVAREILKEDRPVSKASSRAAGESSASAVTGGLPTEEAAAPADRPIGMKTILVPTDFSPVSIRAIPYARRFAELFGAELILLHVTEPITYVPAYCPIGAVNDLRATRRETAEVALTALAAEIARSARGQPTRCRTMVADGDAASETDRIARECAADLIVVASHGFTGLKHLLLGSTTDKIVRRAPCPVLVVRENGRGNGSSTPAKAAEPSLGGQERGSDPQPARGPTTDARLN